MAEEGKQNRVEDRGKGIFKKGQKFFFSLFLFPLLNIILLWGGKGGKDLIIVCVCVGRGGAKFQEGYLVLCG